MMMVYSSYDVIYFARTIKTPAIRYMMIIEIISVSCVSRKLYKQLILHLYIAISYSLI